MAKKIITLNEAELKSLIRNVLNEMAGFDTNEYSDMDDDYFDDSENNEMDRTLSKYDNQTDINQATGGKEYDGRFDKDSSDAEVDDIESSEDVINNDEPEGTFFLCTYNDEDTEKSGAWIETSADEAESCKSLPNGNVEGPFSTREEAEKRAYELGLELTDMDGETNSVDSTENTNTVGPLSSPQSQPEEHHEEGDVIYFENTPIEFKNGKYHMVIEDGFDMGDAKCPKITVVGSSLKDVENEYTNLWDSYYYKEHGRYAQEMLQQGLAEYDFNNMMVGGDEQISLDDLGIIVDLDKQ